MHLHGQRGPIGGQTSNARQRRTWRLRCFALSLALVLRLAHGGVAEPLTHVRVSENGTHFVRDNGGQRFIVWGVNYDHDSAGRLLDEYWIDQWQRVVEDFREIKDLGANCVRIHLQLGKFMDAPDRPNRAAIEQLTKVVRLAEETGLYLDITGLACYHQNNVPAWYDALGEEDRWSTQATFWASVAQACKQSPAIFCYDLMNEPILPGPEPAKHWLTGELGGKFFVQRLTLDLKGRSREQVAQAWTSKMVAAIRDQDERHMITVGVIPWVVVFGGGKPLFYSPQVGRHLDFVALHVYPKSGHVAKTLEALKAYDIDKPLVIEETFPLECGIDELVEFIEGSFGQADGWISFYWGMTAEQLRAKSNPTIGESITAAWLETFRKMSDRLAERR